MTKTFNLTARPHQSQVLANWLATRPGAADRAFDRAVERINNAQVITSSNSDAMAGLFAPIASSSGYSVTDQTAMLVGTVYACLSKLGGAVTQLPIHQYRLNIDGDRQKAAKTPLWWLLNESPAAAWTAASWKEWIVRCVHLRGDQHTEIIRDTRASAGGAIIGLLPHHPDQVNIRALSDGHLVYDVTSPYTGKVYTVHQDDMLHFSGFGFNGLRSISAIQHAARSAIGNSLAAADYAGKTIGEGAMPQIAIKYPNAMKAGQAKDLRDSFVATYSGSGSRKLPLILTEGGEVQTLSISPADIQLLESRRFDREDICQILGVPPVLIGDNDKTSSWGTGIEQITLGFVKYTVKPHLIRWEEELNRKLFRNAGPFVEFDLGGLLRGDTKAQSDAFRAALGGPGLGDGYMSVNEVRRLQNLPPVADGDAVFKATPKTATAPAPANP